MLEVKDVGRNFGGIAALTDVTLSCAPGEIHGVIGPNGAGKTTLFNVVSGLVAPTSGTIHLGEDDITGWSVRRRTRAGIGRSFQRSHLFTSMTVMDNLRTAVLAGRLGRTPWRQVHELIDQLVSDFELEVVADAVAGELAYGQQRNLDLAMALAHRPTVALFDEPTSGMGREDHNRIAALVTKVARSYSCAILLIEHNVPIVLSVSDQITVLHEGTVVANGTPDEMAKDETVKRVFLGSTAS